MRSGSRRLPTTRSSPSPAAARTRCAHALKERTLLKAVFFTLLCAVCALLLSLKRQLVLTSRGVFASGGGYHGQLGSGSFVRASVLERCVNGDVCVCVCGVRVCVCVCACARVWCVFVCVVCVCVCVCCVCVCVWCIYKIIYIYICVCVCVCVCVRRCTAFSLCLKRSKNRFCQLSTRRVTSSCLRRQGSSAAACKPSRCAVGLWHATSRPLSKVRTTSLAWYARSRAAGTTPSFFRQARF
jgi:hypothetical protein